MAIWRENNMRFKTSWRKNTWECILCKVRVKISVAYTMECWLRYQKKFLAISHHSVLKIENYCKENFRENCKAKNQHCSYKKFFHQFVLINAKKKFNKTISQKKTSIISLHFHESFRTLCMMWMWFYHLVVMMSWLR